MVAPPEFENPLRLGELADALQVKVDPETSEVSDMEVVPAEHMDCVKILFETCGVGYTVTTTLPGVPPGHPKAVGVAV